VLDPDVAFRVDAGDGSPLARAPITGAAAVAEQILARGTRFAPHARPAIVNGTAGVIVGDGARPIAVAAFTVVHDRIAAIDLITDPEKLRGLVFVS
jgi:RNA polymerase sigma-70 factor (ECF subfamily)